MSAGSGDIFVAMFTKDGRLWLGEGHGGTDDDWGQGVALGPDGSVYLAGDFPGHSRFRSRRGHVQSHQRAAVKAISLPRLDSAGNFLWAGTTGSAASDSSGRIDNLSQGIAVAYDGSVYTTGQFEGTRGFRPQHGHVQPHGYAGWRRNNGFRCQVSWPAASSSPRSSRWTAPACTNSSTPSATPSPPRKRPRHRRTAQRPISTWTSTTMATSPMRARWATLPRP